MVGDNSLTESGGAVVPASTTVASFPWEPKVKRYRHFDSVEAASTLKSYAMDPALVSRHPFYPLISFDKRWTTYAAKGVSGAEKSRTIKYCARIDAAIFSYYRSLLAVRYEQSLHLANLSDNVLAYRKLASPSGKGKCNIDFALTAFERIRYYENCSVVALDISAFFDNLNHTRIKRLWQSLFGWNELPSDHYQVFKHLTKFAEVDLNDALRALGIKGDVELNDGTFREGFLKHYNDIEPQICYPNDFRSKIAGGDLIKSYRDRGSPKIGVPQGVPLSDLIANLYMLDFDRKIKKLLERFGGYYARYSDDIVLVAPIECDRMARIVNIIDKYLPKLAPGLKIKGKKTEFGRFEMISGRQAYHAIIGKSGGFRYLGFRYDGSKVYLREQTISNLWRKTAKTCNRAAVEAVRRYPTKDASQIIATLPTGRIVEKTGKVEEFFSKEKSYTAWTFWTYAKRAEETFQSFGSGIKKQLKNHHEMVKSQLNQAVVRAITYRDSPHTHLKRKKK